MHEIRDKLAEALGGHEFSVGFKPQTSFLAALDFVKAAETAKVYCYVTCQIAETSSSGLGGGMRWEYTAQILFYQKPEVLDDACVDRFTGLGNELLRFLGGEPGEPGTDPLKLIFSNEDWVYCNEASFAVEGTRAFDLEQAEERRALIGVVNATFVYE